eukprot:3075853-Pyramimonas_sp.AAC.1
MDTQEKYEQLLRQEQELGDFLDHFDSNKYKVHSEVSQRKETIVALLERISKVSKPPIDADIRGHRGLSGDIDIDIGDKDIDIDIDIGGRWWFGLIREECDFGSRTSGTPGTWHTPGGVAPR